MISVRRDFCSEMLCSAGMGFLDAYVTAEVPNARVFSRAGSVLWKLFETEGNAGEHKRSERPLQLAGKGVGCFIAIRWVS